MIKTAFFGTSDKSLPILETLKKETELKFCLTKSDTLVGRNKEVRETEVKKWARENKIEFICIDKFTPEVVQKIQSLDVNYIFVADFSFIIPESILINQLFEVINIHFSSLPKYRGAAPAQFALLNGDKKIGITFQYVVKEMDKGDIIYQVEEDILETDNTETLLRRLFPLASMHLEEVIKQLERGEAKRIKQNEEEATYTCSKTKPKTTLIQKEDAYLGENNPKQIINMVKAFYPWPIAWLYLKEVDSRFSDTKGLVLKEINKADLKVKIFDAVLENEKIKPLTIQVEGANKTDYKSFLNGYFKKA